jgi:hypothetical protein
MPQYGLLIYSPAPADPTVTPPEYAQALERYPAKIEELGGRPITGFAFQPSSAAKSVRGDVVTDGPFIRVSEVVSGFFLVDAPDLDVAVQIAKLNPATGNGGVEVRPLFVPPHR